MLASLILAAAAIMAAAALASAVTAMFRPAAAPAATAAAASVWLPPTPRPRPQPQLLSKPRVSRERLIISARVRWYYWQADAPMRDYLTSMGWPAG